MPMELVSYIQAVLTLVALTILVLAAVRSVQRAVRDLVSMLRKGQREPEPAPPRAALPESPARSEGVPVVPAEPVPSSAVSEPLPASTSKRRPPPHAPPIKVGVPASGVAPPTAMP